MVHQKYSFLFSNSSELDSFSFSCLTTLSSLFLGDGGGEHASLVKRPNGLSLVVCVQVEDDELVFLFDINSVALSNNNSTFFRSGSFIFGRAS